MKKGMLFLWILACSMAWGAESQMLSGTYTGKQFEPGAVFSYQVFIPRQYDSSKPAALHVCCDGLWGFRADVFEKLMDEGAMPVCVVVGVLPGNLPPTREGGFSRFMRGEEYDQPGTEYPNFLVDEFLPWLIAKEKLNIDPSPDRHAMSGGSSGGICAWNAAWYRNDFFRRIFISSPTFSSIRDGVDPMILARKMEARKIRVYMTQGTNEPNLYAGDSYVAALFGESALKYAGYDMRYECFEGGGHCHGSGDFDVLERVYRFLWADWQTKPVQPLRNQERIDTQVEFGTTWEETSEPFPASVPARTEQGEYTFAGGEIFLTTPDGTKKSVASGFGNISALALSSDLWRLYIADTQRRFIFAMSILPDGSLCQRIKHAPLHLSWDCRMVGATDLCVDVNDRVYAATELGIQSIRSMGVIDSIFSLPGDIPAEKIAFGGEDSNEMYATGGGKVFKRSWKVRGMRANDVPSKPGTIEYYD